jgi:hypothetical protein
MTQPRELVATFRCGHTGIDTAALAASSLAVSQLAERDLVIDSGSDPVSSIDEGSHVALRLREVDGCLQSTTARVVDLLYDAAGAFNCDVTIVWGLP